MAFLFLIIAGFGLYLMVFCLMKARTGRGVLQQAFLVDPWVFRILALFLFVFSFYSLTLIFGAARAIPLLLAFCAISGLFNSFLAAFSRQLHQISICGALAGLVIAIGFSG